MILDVHDPSGLGIFSKTGRQLTEKIPVLARRKLHHDRGFDYSQHLQNLELTQPLQPNKTLGRKPQPFSVVVSREKRDNYNQAKLRYPVVGQYRYELTERPQLVIDYLEAYRKAQKTHQGLKQRKNKTVLPPAMVPSSESFETTSSLNRSVGHIDMSKMIGRNQSFRATFKVPVELSITENPEEHCITLDSKMEADERARTRKKGIIRFEKQLSREQTSIKRQTSPLCYDCNYEFIRKNYGKGGPPFDTLTKRRYALPPRYTESASKYDYDNYVWRQNSSVYPKTRVGSIDFTRQTNRYREPVTQG